MQGELRTFPVDSTATPWFNAISYAWGLPKFQNAIQVGESQIPIPDSLFSFLSMKLNEESWWWADSVCINQADDLEKAHQVPLMKDIFQSAGNTYVWLGEKSDDSDEALAFLNYMGKEFWRECEQCPSVRYPSWIQALASRDGEHRAKWDAVERLFQRPWWRRVWTVQEYIVSGSIEIWCGNNTISGPIFNKALSAIWACHRATGTFRYEAQWNRNRILEKYNIYWPNPSLTALLAYLGDHFSTDPRDRIYSLVGLVSDADILGSPNYDASVASLYTNFVKSFVDKHRSLDVICFATRFTDPEDTRSEEKLPSWVPNWSVPVTPLVVPLMVSQGAREHIGNLRPHWACKHSASYAASLEQKPEVSFSANLNEMKSHGIILDVLDGLSQVSSWATPTTNEQRKHDALTQPTSIHHLPTRRLLHRTAQRNVDIVESVMRCLVLDRKDHYMNHSAPPTRFISELRSLVDEATRGKAQKFTHFKTWFQANRFFKVNGSDLDTLFKGTFSPRIPSAHELPEPSYRSDISERQTFASRFHDTAVKMAMRFAVTEHGLLVMTPNRSKKGDVISILYGCSVPVVLRKYDKTDQYQFIGECYVDGYMNGEALSGDPNFEQHTFSLV
ncbi:hypothetical protein BU23DRAFT_573334 [Bimuria novae-zelandiae CBS 107.79]|uniref:Heterokaryon incompatibility domain-containing protein n=1 Tax=Bimuria novae-zelandiae CBS 107.79 TaxID=1447943 RepID=A0A6A5USE8_9PLEO|nr:hypothetical protein BU23DRAFT_573334 [Bimuria novae-zelandiae CBS 107.79]